MPVEQPLGRMSFDASGVDKWATEWADPTGGPLVCHKDLYPENFLFRDDHTVALIDAVRLRQ